MVLASERAQTIRLWLWLACLATTSLLLLALATLRRKVQAEKEAHDELVFLAHHDAMTGVLNRNAFHQRLTIRMASHQKPIDALFFIDLDHFKSINDEYGMKLAMRLFAILPER